MKQNEIIDVFISYRRKDGGTAAKFLFEALKNKNITAFMDVETLDRGDYKQSIKDFIKMARNFVLIVSASVFDSEWVRVEIKHAIEQGKNIIPVFVNGEVCFPSDIPVELMGVDKNAVFLGHDKFDGEFNKLISWLETKHAKLIDEFAQSYNTESRLNGLFDAWVCISSEEAIRKELAEKIKRALQFNTSLESIERMFYYMPTDLIKVICVNLKVDYRGERIKILSRINDWLGNKIGDVDVVPRTNVDRFVVFYEFLSRYFATTKGRKELAQYCTSLGVSGYDCSDHIQMMKLLSYSFRMSGVRDILNYMDFSESNIKEIAQHLTGESVGRKNHLIDLISDWVNNSHE